VDGKDGRSDPARKAAVAVVVTVSDGRLQQATADLRDAGMDVDDIMDALGMVTGTVAEDAIPALEAVPGVIEVERQRTYQVPAPESDIQ
jgi:predicted RNA-binding protein associated with RNAse of E/G family